MKKYNYTKHKIDKSDIIEVNKVLNSDYISQGTYLNKLESKTSRIFNSKYVLAVSSGSAALHLAFKAIGLKKNDYVITTSLTWVASINAIMYCEAKPILIDIDPHSFNISLIELEKFLKYTKKKIKYLLAVHLCGNPIDMIELSRICKKFKIKIIEDAAQALGSKYCGSLIGNNQYSEATVFSMQPTKTITSGEGGLLLTNKKKIYLKAKSLRRHGINNLNNPFPWSDNMTDIGFNYKISEMNCALAFSQMSRYRKIINQRNKIAEFYKKEIKKNKTPVYLQKISKYSLSSYHLFVIVFNKNISLNKKKLLFNALIKNGVGLTLKYLPIYRHSVFKKKYKFKNFPNTEQYFKNSFCIPMFEDLNKSDVSSIIKKITYHYNKL